ncbi:hypothetical protein GH714_037455 [Hevea brasiliensis]|uniref:Haem-binding uptake Tiki superfamily ChaN domain-containing protein n=1 Tax=Hevea brasiliensis TaxID=3981 RepID=A0A6A6L8A7_HEVBR|nr:hypothetical protein GH714_037455 [Hevea brasiliensis]
MRNWSLKLPVKDDKELELEIFKNLRKRCVENEKSISLAMEANPCDLQPQLNQYMDRSIDGETFKSYLSYWPPQRWQEYEPLLSCCRDNGVRIVACGTPLKVIRTVHAKGIRRLSKADRKIYVPPPGSGFISGFTSISLRLIAMNSPNHSVPYGPSSYLPAQSKVVEDYTMSQIILQAMFDGGATNMLVLVTGASHFMYGSKVEIARVMNAAGRRQDALPQDIQEGLNLDLVLPEVLQNFFNLEQYPLLKELGHSFEIIAGIVEHRISDAFASQTLLVDMLSFVVRTINSYWGTQQWVDLARYSGLHGKNGKSSSYHTPGSATEAIVGCNSSQDASIDEIKNQ